MTHHKTSLQILALEDRAVPAILLVDDDRAQFPTAPYTSIQAAVNAAAVNDTVLVAAGTYTEQVTISADKDGLTLRAALAGAAIIQAPAVIVGNSIVAVNGADDVTVRGFRIQGPAVVAGTVQSGVLIAGGSATVRDNRILDIRNNPADGTQTGLGILVYGVDAKTTATIRGNTVSGYQKAGIVVFGSKADAVVRENSLNGGGPTAVIARNGVQVTGGAKGTVRGNDIFGHAYTGDGGATVAVGISVDAAQEVEISGNGVRSNDVGIYVTNSSRVGLVDNAASFNGTGIVVLDSVRVSVSGNQVFRNAQDGIVFGGVTESAVADNRVFANGRDGVTLNGGGQIVVSGNRITLNGRDGLQVTENSRNNTVTGNLLLLNGRYDGFDDTVGSKTAGTANTWRGNLLLTRNRPGLR